MSEREDYRQAADEAGREAEEMAQRNQKLGDEIGEVREDWRQKRADEGVPGATPLPEDADRDAPGDEVNPEDADREEHESPQTEERADSGRGSDSDSDSDSREGSGSSS